MVTLPPRRRYQLKPVKPGRYRFDTATGQFAFELRADLQDATRRLPMLYPDKIRDGGVCNGSNEQIDRKAD